ncbi:MAG: Eco29kI family restriction endonuclease [Halomonas sp.]|nr:Eco29kI family restriction endonuclease [Halomonas sp.]MCC5881909.1 Eco29kI family restriction endonuclease [Halomonas sp.]
MSSQPYNPLEKRHLAESIAREVVDAPIRPLSETSDLVGAGVYAIYYTGSCEWYSPIAEQNEDEQFEQPIYVGKAIPKGGRKGGFSVDPSAKGTALRDRLRKHYSSVKQAENLEEDQFFYRYLLVDDVWIPLGENMLIEQFRPAWNILIDGFGNNQPGGGREKQKRSSWDVLHPGRTSMRRLTEDSRPADEILQDLDHLLQTGEVPKRAKEAAKSLKLDLEDGGADEPED